MRSLMRSVHVMASRSDPFSLSLCVSFGLIPVAQAGRDPLKQVPQRYTRIALHDWVTRPPRRYALLGTRLVLLTNNAGKLVQDEYP